MALKRYANYIVSMMLRVGDYLSMETLLVNLFLLIRPILSINFKIEIWGLSLFEFLTIFLTFLLVLVGVFSAGSRKSLAFNELEYAMSAFIVWCCVITAFYYIDTDLKSLVKLILPLITYMIIRRVIFYKDNYLQSIRWLLIGFSVPIIYSFFVIYTGGGVWGVSYWTGLVRYGGAYSGPHEMSHSLGLFIMLSFVYMGLWRVGNKRRINKIFLMYLLLMITLALYCIYKGYVRTVFIGLFVFIATYAFYRSKLLFVTLGTFFAVTLIVLGSLFTTIFHDVVEVYTGDREIEDAGSGRPYIWKRNFEVFSLKSADRIVAGVGIGNYAREPNWNERVNQNSQIWNSHNDWLEMLFETGVVGLLLLSVIYIIMYRKICKLGFHEKIIFLALLNAVVVMNFLSNSYISRFSIAQMLFVTLVYIDLKSLRRSKSVNNNKKIRYDR